MTEDGISDAHGEGEAPGDFAPRQSPPSPADQRVRGDAKHPGPQPQPDEESEIWKGRTHWKHYAGRLILWLLGNGVVAVLMVSLSGPDEWLSRAAAFAVILGLLLVSGGFVLGRIAVIILSRRYRLTTQRLFVHRGILSQTVDQMELIRVDDVRIHKSVTDRVFGLGSVEVLSTDTSGRDVVIDGIADPDHLAEAIRTNMRRLRSKSLYVERL